MLTCNRERVRVRKRCKQTLFERDVVKAEQNIRLHKANLPREAHARLGSTCEGDRK